MSNELILKGAAASTHAFLEETEESLGGLLLPTVKVGGDPAAFIPAKGNDPKDMDLLPDGGKARAGIYIGKRMGVLSWKVGFDDKATAGEDKGGPAFVALAPDDAIEDVKLIGKATKARQMTAKVSANKIWDFANSQVGHLKPLAEFLVFFPETGFTVITHSPNYHDVVDAIAGLKNIADKETGEINMPVVMFKPARDHHKSKSYEWDASFCSVSLADEKVKAAVQKQFAEYQAIIKDNIVVQEAVKSWLRCADRPMTDEIREALKRGIALNPPKY